MNKNGYDLKDPSYFINRELSQIEFFRRVLNEAFDDTHPLLERVKFMAIFSNILDEFFMVRVSGLKQLVLLGIIDRPPDGLTPREQLVVIHKKLTELSKLQMEYWRLQLHNELREAGIQIYDFKNLKSRKKRKLREYFENEIFPVLTPLLFDPGHPFPHISNLSLNLAAEIRDPSSGAELFARIKYPQSCHDSFL